MLGYVNQDTHELEVRARITAEARAQVLEEQLRASQETNSRLLDELRQQRESHERQSKTVLEHVTPIAANNPLTGEPGRRLSADELAQAPASSRREMEARARQVRLARAREEQEADKVAREERERMFSSAEKQEMIGEYDAVLGYNREPVAVTPTEEASHANN